MGDRIDISSLPISEKAFVFSAMTERTLIRMEQDFPEWAYLLNPILVQKRYLAAILTDLEYALAKMQPGESAERAEARLGDAGVYARLRSAFSMLNRPEIVYSPDIPSMEYAFIEGFANAARAAMDGRKMAARTVRRVETEKTTAQGGDETEMYRARSAVYLEMEKAVRSVRERLLPRETFAGFRGRNCGDEGAIVVGKVFENQGNVRPWIGLFDVEAMERGSFDLLLQRLQVEKWESDVLEEVIREAGHAGDL